MNIYLLVVMFFIGIYVLGIITKWILKISIIWDEEKAKIKWMKKHNIHL